MRLILHNPHIGSNCYKIGVPNIYNRKMVWSKYSYIFDYLYHREGKVYVYLNNIGKGLFSVYLEFIMWVVINGLNPFKFRIIHDLKKTSKEDAILLFIVGNLTNGESPITKDQRHFVDELSISPLYKIGQLTHYGVAIAQSVENVCKGAIDLLISENNLPENSLFFKTFYSSYKGDFYVMPFVPKSKYIRTTSFNLRKNKAVAMGSIAYINDKDFITYWGTSLMQPMRMLIAQNTYRLKPFIDSFISDYWNVKQLGLNSTEIKSESEVSVFEPKSRIKEFLWRCKKYFRLFIYVVDKYCFLKKDICYYRVDRMYNQLDLVSIYNEYRMFIVPEEALDLPGIGFVEGMASGCAYIGLRSPMYSDIGMIEGVHYIAYDGTLEDLCEKIAYYQDHEEELQIIAENGYDFVVENCNGDLVMSRFLDYLKKKIVV